VLPADVKGVCAEVCDLGVLEVVACGLIGCS